MITFYKCKVSLCQTKLEDGNSHTILCICQQRSSPHYGSNICGHQSILQEQKKWGNPPIRWQTDRWQTDCALRNGEPIILIILKTMWDIRTNIYPHHCVASGVQDCELAYENSTIGWIDSIILTILPCVVPNLKSFQGISKI